MKIFHGDIITCNSSNNVVNYLVEHNGKIEFVGDKLPEKYLGENISQPLERIELGSRALLPSFVDSHIHFSSWALFAQQLYLGTLSSLTETELKVKKFASSSKQKILIGFGVSAHNVKEKRLPTRDDLDQWCPEKPLYLVKYDGHAAVANSALFKLFPPEIETKRGFHSDTGFLNQDAFFAATDFVTNSISSILLIKNMVRSIDLLAEQGIGMIHNVEGVGFPRDLDLDLVRTIARGQKNGFQFRIYFQTMDSSKVLKRNLPRIGGCFATALDGCFGSVDAALVDPYTDHPDNSGVLYYTDEEVIKFTCEAHDAGLQIQMHAIGDAAFEQAVKALEIAITKNPRPDHRHGIIHACLTTPGSLQKCAELGICIASQPAFLDWAQEPLEYLQEVLGERISQISPHRTMLDLGIHISGGSDGPCTWPNPIEGIYCACNHFIPQQSISIPEALRMFTYEAAYMSFDEQERGSLEKGKIADMVILNKNPLKMNPSDLRQLHVEQLYLNGGIYHPGQSMASVLWNGLIRGKKDKKI